MHENAAQKMNITFRTKNKYAKKLKNCQANTFVRNGNQTITQQYKHPFEYDKRGALLTTFFPINVYMKTHLAISRRRFRANYRQGYTSHNSDLSVIMQLLF